MAGSSAGSSVIARLRGSRTLNALRSSLETTLEWVVLFLMAALAVVVVLGVGFRKAGAALVWYDEVASILLAWLTYYGAALAALKRAHIGVPTVVQSLRGPARTAAVLLADAFVIGFFVVVAWAGWQVMVVLGGNSLISLPWVPTRVAQSVIPIGAMLFILAQLLSIPEALAEGPHPSADDDENGGDGRPEGTQGLEVHGQGDEATELPPGVEP